MTRRLVCVVEGHGEVQAAPELVARVLVQLLGVSPQDWAVDRDPIRVPRGDLVDRAAPSPRRTPHPRAERALHLAATRRPGGVLVLCDADDDCPAAWGGPFRRMTPTRPAVPVRAVMACREFESWVLWGYPVDDRRRVRALDPEVAPRDAKGALQRLRPGYKPSVHQREVVQTLPLPAVWAASDSFDKLVRSVSDLVGVRPPPRPS